MGKSLGVKRTSGYKNINFEYYPGVPTEQEQIEMEPDESWYTFTVQEARDFADEIHRIADQVEEGRTSE